MQNFPEGLYELEITGSVGSLSDSFKLEIELVDPCPTAQITLSESPLLDTDILIGDQVHETEWSYQDLFTIDTQVDCGSISVDFFNEEDYSSPIDADLFNDFRDSDSNSYNIFSVSADDVAKVGVYPISYRVYYQNYPENFEDKINAATIVVTDPCSEPFGITATSQMFVEPYLFTGDSPSLDFLMNPFETDPPSCPVTYSCEMMLGASFDLCQVIDEDTVGSFDTATGNYQLKSTDIENFAEGHYELEITGALGPLTDSITIEIELVNPCPTATITL